MKHSVSGYGSGSLGFGPPFPLGAMKDVIFSLLFSIRNNETLAFLQSTVKSFEAKVLFTSDSPSVNC